MTGRTLHFEIRRNRPHAGAALVPRLRTASTLFKRAVAAGDAKGMARSSDSALRLMVSLADLLRGEQDAERLPKSSMTAVTGLIAKDLTINEREAMITAKRLDRSHVSCRPATLRGAFNKIVHCDAAHCTYRIDGRGAHYLVLSGPGQGPYDGLWVAEILVATLCSNAAAAIEALRG